MPLNVTQKLIKSHLLTGKMIPGEEIGIKIDQTLTQDATGTMVMLELEAMGIERAQTEVSAQYVDHNIIQQDNKTRMTIYFYKVQRNDSDCITAVLEMASATPYICKDSRNQEKRCSVPIATRVRTDAWECSLSELVESMLQWRLLENLIT